MTLADTEHQETNVQVEVTSRTLLTMTKSLMVHARFLEVYIHIALMYTTYQIFPVIPIKYLIEKTAIQPRRLNLQQVRNLQYHIYASYLIYVLYEKILNTLGQRC